MGITVGAALKKVASALLSDPEVLKKVLFAILVVLVALLLPMVMVVCLFSGRFQVDTAELQRHVEANLTASDIQLLRSVEDTMTEIENAMIDAELGGEVGAAQALYIMALYDDSSQPGFVSRLVSCFQPEQTDEQLIAAVNSAFGSNIVTEDFTKLVGNVRSQYVDTSNFVYPTTKNNLDLVQWAIAAEAAGWGYVWGTFGQVLTRDALAAKVAQYPDNVGIYEEYIRSHYLGKRTADCAGFIKGYCWYNSETDSVNYATNGMPDLGANQMYQTATVKGPISTMPEIPGLAVWHQGHIGVYIGNGYAIEAMGTRYGIDFACRFYGMDYPEAVQLMLSMGVGTVREEVEPFPQKPLEMPSKHDNMRRVYGYLIRRRGIDKDVLDASAVPSRRSIQPGAASPNAGHAGTMSGAENPD